MVIFAEVGKTREAVTFGQYPNEVYPGHSRGEGTITTIPSVSRAPHSSRNDRDDYGVGLFMIHLTCRS
jgi:hypothetical protein